MSGPYERSPTIDRRTLLSAMAGGSLALLSGCSEDGNGATTTPETTTRTATRSPTATESGTSIHTTTDEPTETATGQPTPSIEELRNVAIDTVYDLDEGRYDAVFTRVTDEVANQVTAEELGTIWERRASSKGRLESVTVAQQGAQGGYEVFVLRATFESGALRVVLSFSERGQIAGIQFRPTEESYSPPEYADTSAFSETTLTLDTGCGLGATLTVPEGDETVPGVVLVHGSGPNDRDETVRGTKPFKDLAWGLASRGVAVLRYDKRTHACDVSGGISLDEKVVDDALVALDRLDSHDRIDTRVVVGHSLGAMAAPRIAAEDGDLAGAAMLAAPVRPIHEMILDQLQYLANLDGTVTDAERSRLEETRTAVERIRAGEIDPDEEILGFTGEFWNSLAEYDQVETARQLSVPLLFMQGTADYKVTVEDDFERWKAALGDRKTVSFSKYDGLNHRFMSESQAPANVERVVVEDLATWIDDRA